MCQDGYGRRWRVRGFKGVLASGVKSHGIAKRQEEVFRDLNVAVDIVVSEPRLRLAVQDSLNLRDSM